MAKKSDKDEKSAPDKPRILLKPKDTPEQSRSTITTPQISIASRPVDHSSNNADTNKASRSQPTPTTSKDSKDTPTTTLNENSATEYALPSMKKPFSIISDHYQLLNQTQDFLIETNSDFTVIGVIGTQGTFSSGQNFEFCFVSLFFVCFETKNPFMKLISSLCPPGSGKSFILNMLVDDEPDFNDATQVEKLLKGEKGVFRMRNQLKERLTNLNYTEGIQMYITRHRTILLDCSPILCNPYKKESVLNELDDLKMLIFLLNVCNTLIVVEDCGFNLHLMRLLLTAESMKVDVYENDLNERRHSPNILLFKNKCQNRDFLNEAKLRTKQLYHAFFQCSGLKMLQSGRNQVNKLMGVEDELDIFCFPWIDLNGEGVFCNFSFVFFCAFSVYFSFCCCFFSFHAFFFQFSCFSHIFGLFLFFLIFLLLSCVFSLSFVAYFFLLLLFFCFLIFFSFFPLFFKNRNFLFFFFLFRFFFWFHSVEPKTFC